MDAAKSVFKLVLLNGDWYWRLDLTEEGLIGPFASKEKANKDARETLGFANSEDTPSNKTSKENEGRAEMLDGGGYAYIVNADHVDGKYRAEIKPVVVRRQKEGFSASAYPYGLGAHAATPDEAIRVLLEKHGCTNVRVKHRPKTEWD